MGSLSAAMVLALLGFLTLEGLARQGGTPQLELRAIRHIEQPVGTTVVIEVHNRGKATAAEVAIRGTSPGSSDPREVTLDYAPAESVREVTLVFPEVVALDTLTLDVLGYREP